MLLPKRSGVGRWVSGWGSTLGRTAGGVDPASARQWQVSCEVLSTSTSKKRGSLTEQALSAPQGSVGQCNHGEGAPACFLPPF